ncbi:MAG: hypothetical protein Q9167_005797 [Letrouitia subvulpina]
MAEAKAGRADGLKFLTLEIFDALGIYDHVMSEACRHEEICHWSPGKDGTLQRLAIVPDIVPGLDEPREVTLAQDKVEQYLEDNLTRQSSIKLERGKVPVALVVDGSNINDSNSHPLQLSLKDISSKATNETKSLNNGYIAGTEEEEIIHARYCVGCDGANSWTRNKVDIGVQLEGTDSIWGVIDIVPKTNFPDIRKACTIRSASSGSLLIEPREGRLVRFYVHLENVAANRGSSFDKSTCSPEKIANIARNIMFPYKLEYSVLEWWSAYHVKQQVANALGAFNRVFIAGDAVHILKTYELERKPIAHALINFDRAYVPLFSNGCSSGSEKITSSDASKKFQTAYVEGLTSSTGIAIRYEPNMLVAEQGAPSCSEVAKNVVVGMRLKNVKIINQADGVMIRIQKLVKPDGKFRLLVFPGDISKSRAAQRMLQLGEDLSHFKSEHPKAPYACRQVEIITVHAAKRADIELLDLHEVFHPWSDEGGWDYWKVYSDDSTWHEGACDTYNTLGISTDGCMILVRPDGYVSVVCRMGDVGSVKRFLAGCIDMTSE